MAVNPRLVRILADMVERAMAREDAAGDCHPEAVESEPREHLEVAYEGSGISQNIQ